MSGVSLPYQPVAFFFGDDTHEMEREISRRIEQLVAPEARPFDLEVLYADEVEADAVISAANTFPVLGALRVVVVRRLEAWRMQITQLRRLAAEYVVEPSPTTRLMLCYLSELGFKAASRDRRREPMTDEERKKHLAALAPPRRTRDEAEAEEQEETKGRVKILKALLALAGEIRVFTPPGVAQVCRQVEEHFRSKGIRLARGTAQVFAERLGGDRHRLQGELAKVEMFCAGRREPLEPEEVVELLERSARRYVFDLPKAIGLGDRRRAARLLEELLEDGGEALLILGAITAHYRRLLQARAVVELGGGRAEVARELNLKNPRWANELLDELRATGDQRLERAFPLLAAADARLKSSSSPRNLKRPKDQPSIILQTLLAELLA